MKKFNYSSLLVGASAMALIALIFFQLRWMHHSNNLLEEQFKHRVDMALCNAVEQMATSESCASLEINCSTTSTEGNCQIKLDSIFKTEEGDNALREALAFYKLDLPYEVSVEQKKIDQPDNLGCSLSPLLADDSHYLNIYFNNREAYILDKMGFMAVSSFAIILFVGLVFILSTYYLIRQKRLRERNMDFFNHMTHEFRTPLTNIKLASKLLAKNKLQDKGQQYVTIIQQESHQLMEQVDRVLQLARLEEGDYQLRTELIHLPTLLQNVLQEMSLQLSAHSAEVSLNIDPDIPSLNGDPFHLSNALRNLIDNALKYSAPGAQIKIDIQEKDNGFSVRVQDNGQGIPRAQQARIFDKFQQGKPGPSQAQKGFGLGLAYVKKIVDLHRGQIKIESVLGQGTCFDLFFPVSQNMQYVKTS